MQMRVRSITLNTSQLGKIKSFYEALGVQLTEKSVDKGGKIYRGDFKNLELEIRGLDSSEATINPQVQLCIEVSDLSQICAQLNKVQAFFLMEPTDMPDGAMAILQDPDGRAIQLIEVK